MLIIIPRTRKPFVDCAARNFRALEKIQFIFLALRSTTFDYDWRDKTFFELFHREFGCWLHSKNFPPKFRFAYSYVSLEGTPMLPPFIRTLITEDPVSRGWIANVPMIYITFSLCTIQNEMADRGTRPECAFKSLDTKGKWHLTIWMALSLLQSGERGGGVSS